MNITDFSWALNSPIISWICNGFLVRKKFHFPVRSAILLIDGTGVAVVEPFGNCSGSEMRPREFSGSRGGGWRQVGHEGLADDQLMTGVQKVVALFAAGGEIAANPGESLRPGQRAKAA